MGIEPELLPKLFDVFEQGDITITRRFGGLGLGLSICHSIVNLHGGAILAHSAGPGTGATFTVELPTNRADSREMLASLLADLNYTVRIAGSVASALELAAIERFDIVVSDLGLPDGTGWDLMKQLRDRYGIKGIALSGYGMGEDQQRTDMRDS